MDRLFGAGVASHATIIEQINYLMFLRALTKHDDEAKLLNPNHEEIFKGDLAKYRWDNLLMLNADVLFDTLEEAYRKLPELTTDKIISLLFRNAHIKIYDKPTLRVLLHEIEKLVTELDDVARHGEKDIFGDMYEYLLSKLAQAGTNGQFRTPRHIIKFIVDVVDPNKSETILDPACGTAGFLVEALDHLRHKYTSERFIKDGAYPMDKLTGDERDFIFNHAFTGFDSDEDMVKFGVMNLYLHNLNNAQIKRQNTLVDTAGDRTKWDVILANPPFAGKIESESVSEDLRMGTRATEVLFVRYMIDHLSSQGKAGIIVPEGIIFQSTNAHKQLRQKLIDAGLWCVVSLPSGVFQPYSGVKTSILFIDKELAKKFNRIMFIMVNSDGFDLSANRRPVVHSDLPNTLKLIQYCKDEIEKGHIREDYYFPFEDKDSSISIAPLQYSFEKVDRINQEYDLTLQANRYALSASEITTWPLKKLKDICDVRDGTHDSPKYVSSGYPLVTSKNLKNGAIDLENVNLISEKDYLEINKRSAVSRDDILMPMIGTIGNPVIVDSEPRFAIKNVALIKFPNDNKKIIINKYLYYVLLGMTEIFEKHSSGSTQKFISLNYIRNIEVPMPSLDLQREIVTELEGYQKITDSLRELKENYRPTLNLSGFTNNVPFIDVATLEYGFSLPKPKRSPGIHPVVGSNGIVGHHNTYKVEGPAIIVGRKGSAGEVVWVNDNCYPIDTTYYVKLRNDFEYSLRFLYYYLKQQRLTELKGGAGVPGLNRNDVYNKVSIPKISLHEQELIVKSLDREQEIISSSLSLLDSFQEKIQSRIKELWV